MTLIADKMRTHKGKLEPKVELITYLDNWESRKQLTDEEIQERLESPVILAIFDHLSDFFFEYTKRLLEAGKGRIDIAWYGDDYGCQTGLTISPQTYKKLLKPRWKRHIELAHSFGAVVMLHSCGSTRKLIPDLIETGFDILDTVQPEAADMNPAELKRKFGDRLSFHGMISVQQVLPHGTTEDVRREVKERMEVMKPGGGYIMAPTHCIQPDTPVENILAMYEAGLEFGRY